MKYDFKCDDCGHGWEEEMSFKAFAEAREEGLPCRACAGGKAFNVFNPGALEISMKGFAWADKNYKEKESRKRRSRYMASRQKTAHQTPELVPNFGGERVATWKEARDAARDAGKFHETYDALVRQESLKT